jgi:uncharacterized cupin superfamily protein
MKIIQRKDAILRENPGGHKSRYYLFDDYEVIQTDQPAHSEQAWHHHETIWETIYILEGELVVLWREDGAEKSKLVRAGDLLETERSSHTFRNDTDKLVRLMAIKHMPSSVSYREVFKSDKVVDSYLSSNSTVNE